MYENKPLAPLFDDRDCNQTPFSDSSDEPLTWASDDSGSADNDESSICDGCPGCLEFCRLQPLPNEAGFHQLIAAMVHEIDLLEAEVVRTRHVLTQYLPERWADGLRDDIFRGLSARFEGEYEAYDDFLAECCNGIDPLESDEHVSRMCRLRDGTDETTYYHLLPR